METGSWLFGRKILLSPEALLTPDWEKQVFPVGLTMGQIRNSPEIGTDKPVSRQQETELYGYYPWTYLLGWWFVGPGHGHFRNDDRANNAIEQAIHNEVNAEGKENDKDPHLRSTDKITSCNIQATDWEIGDVEDFIINADTWTIDFMEVDTGHCFPGKKVLIAPKWIRQINWDTSLVMVNATEEKVKNSPEYIPREELSDSYEAGLINYYGRFTTHK